MAGKSYSLRWIWCSLITTSSNRISYFGARTASGLDPNDWVRVRPDIAIEVVSPSTVRIDRGRKRHLLARHSVPEYWLVDPDVQTLEVWLLGRDGCADSRRIASGVYECVTQPGLRIDLPPLFAGLDPVRGRL